MRACLSMLKTYLSREVDGVFAGNTMLFHRNTGLFYRNTGLSCRHGRLFCRNSGVACIPLTSYVNRAVKCSALQCVAVRCCALQCVAVCCIALQCVAVRCSVAVCYRAFLCVSVCCRVAHHKKITWVSFDALAPHIIRSCACKSAVALCCNESQHAAICRSVSHCVTACCSML